MFFRHNPELSGMRRLGRLMPAAALLLLLTGTTEAIQNCAPGSELIFVSTWVDRFFLVQHTKTGKIYQITINLPNGRKVHIPNVRKVYQMSVKYTKWP
jgi:hypothetical protein